mmetsp:Transcript_80629/g.172474  ORF Transcript_80629/g.172474 Transcript_80629/m.172474 type:complete len:378 (-) Transcript_80629:519-1652(-)
MIDSTRASDFAWHHGYVHDGLCHPIHRCQVELIAFHSWQLPTPHHVRKEMEEHVLGQCPRLGVASDETSSVHEGGDPLPRRLEDEALREPLALRVAIGLVTRAIERHGADVAQWCCFRDDTVAVKHVWREHTHRGDVVQLLGSHYAAELQEMVGGIYVVLTHELEGLGEVDTGRTVENMGHTTSQALKVQKGEAQVPIGEIPLDCLHTVREARCCDTGTSQRLQEADARCICVFGAHHAEHLSLRGLQQCRHNEAPQEAPSARDQGHRPLGFGRLALHLHPADGPAHIGWQSHLGPQLPRQWSCGGLHEVVPLLGPRELLRWRAHGCSAGREAHRRSDGRERRQHAELRCLRCDDGRRVGYGAAGAETHGTEASAEL